MKRRNFLALAGTTAASSFVPADSVAAGGGPPLDPARLHLRNRDRSAVVAPHGMVCASQPLAAQIGIDVLKAGGTCVDAAIATNAALGLMEPGSCGIGGDLFAILWAAKDKKLYGLNASGRAPAAWTLEKAKALGLTSIPRRSPLSWSVPGCVSGWSALSERFGRLGLARVLEPSIAYAREGFPLSPIIAAEQFSSWKDADAPHLAAVFHPGGKAPGYGDVFRNPLLAASYERIAKGGALGFYEGETAERIVAKSRELGGHLALADLRAHRADWVDPVSSSYRGYDVWEIPPNGQGICALQILNIMEESDVAGPGPQLGGLPAPLRGGQEAGLRGPRPLLRRPRLRRGPGGLAHLQGVRAQARARRSTRGGPPPRWPTATPSSTRTRSTCARPTARATWSRSSRATTRASARASAPTAWASPCRTAASRSPSTRGTATAWSPASGPSTPSSPPS